MEKFFNYAVRHYDKMLGYLGDHIMMCVSALLLSLLIAIPLCALLMRSKKVTKIVLALLVACYSIPSMAFFAIMMPFFGLGKVGPIVVLTIYSQFILVRNILAGFNGIDSSLLEAAKGMGMSPVQIFFKVQLPLAMPVIVSGIHIASVVIIGSATIAQTVNAGGIGVLLFEGLRTQNYVKMIWGTILTAALALSVNYLLARLEKFAQRKAKGGIA